MRGPIKYLLLDEIDWNSNSVLEFISFPVNHPLVGIGGASVMGLAAGSGQGGGINLLGATADIRIKQKEQKQKTSKTIRKYVREKRGGLGVTFWTRDMHDDLISTRQKPGTDPKQQLI